MGFFGEVTDKLSKKLKLSYETNTGDGAFMGPRLNLFS